jgi:hypothetical protein
VGKRENCFILTIIFLFLNLSTIFYLNRSIGIIADSTGQNDAGSGSDAGETFGSAIGVNLITQYSGVMGQGYFNVENELDNSDWFAFSVPNSGNISCFADNDGTVSLQISITSNSSSYTSSTYGSGDVTKSEVSDRVNVSLPIGGIYYLKLYCAGTLGYVKYNFSIVLVAWNSPGQNDANLNIDAEGTFDTAPMVRYNRQYSGTIGQGYFTKDNLLDRQDWFAFEIPDSGNVNVFLERKGSNTLSSWITSRSSDYAQIGIVRFTDSGWINATLPIAGIYFLKFAGDAEIGFVNYKFTIYVYPPIITINSPEAQTYASSDLVLNFSISAGAYNVILDNISLGALPTDSLLTNLVESYHNLTLQVITWQNKVYTKTIIFQIDMSSPVLSRAFNFSNEIHIYEESSQNFLNWTAEDINPKMYTLFVYKVEDLEEILIEKRVDFWVSGEEISINLDDLTYGKYNITLTITDLAENCINDTVLVSVLDQTPPHLTSSPGNTSFTVGSDASLSWSVSDSSPWRFVLYQNRTMCVTNASWNSNSPIVIDVNNLTVGTFNFTIVIFDLSGNSIQDTVYITTMDQPISSTSEITTTTIITNTALLTTTTSPSMTSNSSFIWFLLILGVVSSIIRRRRLAV